MRRLGKQFLGMAVLAALGGSGLSANSGYGWIDSITNTTKNFIMFQSTDPGGGSGGAGHINILHVQSDRVRDIRVNNITLLGAPYFLCPKDMKSVHGVRLDSYTLDNFPVPWQGGGDGGGTLEINVYIQTVGGEMIGTQFKVQEQNDSAVVMCNNQAVNSVPRNGNTHYNLTIDDNPGGPNNGVMVNLAIKK